MSDTRTPRSLLAQLSWWFHPRMEEVAVEALAYILNRYPASRGGLNELVGWAVPDLRLSHETFETEAADLDLTRPDVLQKGDDGKERLFIEAKFYAGLTRNQPVRYLERLPDEGISALMFLAPSGRAEELWPQLLRRLEKKCIPHSDLDHPRCVQIDGTRKHLFITDWMTLLDSMGGRLEGSESGLAELGQLRGLVRFAEDREEKARRPGKLLVERVTKIGRASGWLDTKGLNVTPRPYGHGRYARFGRRYRIGVWLGINSDLWEECDSTPMWLDCRKWVFPNGQGWNERVHSTLQDRMGSHVKQIGKKRWVAVVPEGGKGADSYAAALEQIADILDELAEP